MIETEVVSNQTEPVFQNETETTVQVLQSSFEQTKLNSVEDHSNTRDILIIVGVLVVVLICVAVLLIQLWICRNKLRMKREAMRAESIKEAQLISAAAPITVVFKEEQFAAEEEKPAQP